MSLRTRQSARRFIEVLAALERRRESALGDMVGLFSPMARIVSPMHRHAHTERTGEVGARQFWCEYLGSFGEVRTEFYEVTSADRSAGLFWTSRGGTVQGAAFEYDGATLLVYDDDFQIVVFRGYYDSRDLEIHPRPPSFGRRRPGTGRSAP